jgi:predicted RNase H-like HicB family nuclease
MDLKSFSSYIITVRPNTPETVVAYISSIPGCHAIASDPIDALKEVKKVFDTMKLQFEYERDRIMK